MKYNIEYVSYEGNIRHTTGEGDNEDEAVYNAIDAQGNYSGDNIHVVISVEEAGEDEEE
jgi:hypothetical protein